MKAILVDNTNNGLLWASESQVVCNHLRSGLIDTNVKHVHTWNERYNDFGFGFFGNHWMLTKNSEIITMPDHLKNDYYLQKKTWVMLRVPLVAALHRRVTEVTYASAHVWPAFDNNIETALNGCDPVEGTFSDEIREYAQINDIDPLYAYRELKIRNDNAKSTKFRMFAWCNKFMTEINAVTTQEQADHVRTLMQNKFFKDSSL